MKHAVPRTIPINDRALMSMINAQQAEEFDDIKNSRAIIVRIEQSVSTKEIARQSTAKAIIAKINKSNERQRKTQENLELVGRVSSSAWADKVRDKQKAAKRQFRGNICGTLVLTEEEKENIKHRYRKGQKSTLSRKAQKRLEYKELKLKRNTSPLAVAAAYKKLRDAEIKRLEIQDAIMVENVFANLSAGNFIEPKVESNESEISPEIYNKYMVKGVVVATLTFGDYLKSKLGSR